MHPSLVQPAVYEFRFRSLRLPQPNPEPEWWRWHWNELNEFALAVNTAFSVPRVTMHVLFDYLAFSRSPATRSIWVRVAGTAPENLASERLRRYLAHAQTARRNIFIPAGFVSDALKAIRTHHVFRAKLQAFELRVPSAEERSRNPTADGRPAGTIDFAWIKRVPVAIVGWRKDGTLCETRSCHNEILGGHCQD